MQKLYGDFYAEPLVFSIKWNIIVLHGMEGRIRMAILDKIGSIAKTATDKAGETIEVTKLNVKINSIRDKMGDSKKNLGDYYYRKFSEGAELDDFASDLCKQIIAFEEEIAQLQEQIQAVKES